MTFDFGELGGGGGGGEETHIVKFGEEEGFVFVSESGVGWEGCEAVGEMFEAPAYPVVFLEVSRLLDVVSSNHCRISMVIVAFVGRKVYFLKELLLMMLQFPDHRD